MASTADMIHDAAYAARIRRVLWEMQYLYLLNLIPDQRTSCSIITARQRRRSLRLT